MNNRINLIIITSILIFIIQSSSAQQRSLASQLSQLKVSAVEQDVTGDWLLGKVTTKSSLTRSARFNHLVLSNGLVSRVFAIAPNGATIALDNKMTGQSELRAVRPEAVVSLNGKSYDVGGLKGQASQNYLTERFVTQMTSDPSAFQLQSFKQGPTVERFPWKRNRSWSSKQLPWPAPGIRLTFTYAAPLDATAEIKDVTIEVVYEIYDGMPVISKWLNVNNAGKTDVHLDSFKSEVLALVESAPKVDTGIPREYRVWGRSVPPVKDSQTDAPRDYIDRFTQLFVVTDYAMGGDMEAMKDNPGVRWVHDHPEYEKTGIRYYGQYKPARVECTPPFGPDIDIKSGTSWESFRAFELLRDATDDECRGLAERRFWSYMAPWTQENPIFMHVSKDDDQAVKTAIDQSAQVGFEMVIMTFGSGFNIESKDPAYLDRMKGLGDYARARGIALGGYSLLASRGGKAENLIVSESTGKAATSHKDGSRFGKTPCLATDWGTQYFQDIHNFFGSTGMNVLEHDGSYPGDPCASHDHSGHKGFNDSQWTQWAKTRDLYRWARGQGIYLNVPDWHFLNGSSKTAMGYVETNWSLPRAYQEIIERQNIYDGTWLKTPSMGWMFVPLTQYHGGGAAATIEPLNDHLDHYERRMANLFGAGVQAIYRGPRLYDTEKTKATVKKMVGFYKKHRAILDANIIHLRRADGRDWDGLLHVDPQGIEKGLVMLYNPLDEDIVRSIKVPLYYTGLKSSALISERDGKAKIYKISDSQTVTITVTIPKNGYTWYTLK
jgi:hypothetical protein